MNRKFLITMTALVLMFPALARADHIQDSIVQELAEQGYTHVKITTTWLGRTRFLASDGSRQREIIINANTGEILRDYWQDLNAQDVKSDPHIIDSSSGGDSGGGDTNPIVDQTETPPDTNTPLPEGDDDQADDHDDDHDDDDHKDDHSDDDEDDDHGDDDDEEDDHEDEDD